MRTAILSLLALSLLSTGAAYPPVLAASGLPDESYLMVIGAIVIISAGCLHGLVNLLKVLEYFKTKRQGELAGNNSGLVSRHTLDEELNRVYQRIEERDKRLEEKIDRLVTTVTTLGSDIAAVKTSISFLRDTKGNGRAVPRG